MSDTSPHSLRLWRVLLIATGLAALAATPFLYSAAKKHRAASLANKSIQLADANQPAAARDAAEAAFNLNPDSPASLRARARSAPSPTDAFLFGNALLQTGAATPEDLRHFLNTCLELNLNASVEVRLKQLLSAEPSEIDNWLLAGRYHLARGQNKIALDCASRALELDGENRAARMLTAEIALASSEEVFRNAAVAAIDRLVVENRVDRVSLDAVRLRLPDTATELIAHPLASATDQMLGAYHQLAVSASAAERKNIIQMAIARHEEDNLAELTHWLTANGFAEESLRLVDYSRARTSADLFTAWCHAMNRAGRAEQLIETIEDPSKHSEIPLAAESLELVLVDAYEVSHRHSIAEVHWNKVLRDARSGNRIGKALRLAQWAERHGYQHRAIDLYRKLIENAPDYTPHWYDRIAQLARTSDQLPLLLEVTSELYASAPENVVYQHNFAYLSVLAGRDLDEAARILNSLIQRFPEADSARCALALLEKHKGNHAAAIVQLESVSPERLDPPTEYIYLTLQGRTAKRPESITPYEAGVLQAAIQEN